MIEYFSANHAHFWFAVGFVLLIIEALAFGFGSGFLIFIGIGGIITGSLMSVGILPETWLAGIATFGISSGISAALLWKPLLSLQNDDAPGKDNSSDMVGLEFVTEQEITRQSPGSKRYSGIEWRVEIGTESEVSSIQAGTRVSVTSVDVGVMRVKPI